MNTEIVNFDKQLRSLISHSSGRHLDMAQRLQELGRRMGELDVAQDRVLEMLTVVAAPVVPLRGEEPATASVAGSIPSPAPSFPPQQDPWSIPQTEAPRSPKYGWPQDESDPLPRVAQAIHRNLHERRG